MSELTHLGPDGRPRMVDVSHKPPTARSALARGIVRLDAETLNLVQAQQSKKGDVARVAELAGIAGAKKTSELIPLCHMLPLSFASVTVEADPDLPGLIVSAECRTTGQTGVEMEALCAVAITCLTIYDMLKGASRQIVIERIHLVEKRGGASGDWESGTADARPE